MKDNESIDDYMVMMPMKAPTGQIFTMMPREKYRRTVILMFMMGIVFGFLFGVLLI